MLLNGDTKLAEQLLTRYGDLRELAQASARDLGELAEHDRTRLLAVMELSKRLIAFVPGDRPLVRSAEEAARLVADMSLLRQEHVRAILLDLSRHVIAIPTLYIGTLNASVLRISEIFREAIARNSPAIILVHNHPAGDAAPSPEDIELTRTVIAAGKLLDIAVIDHLIIAPTGWVSIKDLGLAF